MTPAKVKQRCARGGCRNLLSLEARLRGDLHCSTLCFRVDHGLISLDEARESKRRSESARFDSGTIRDLNARSWASSGRGREAVR